MTQPETRETQISARDFPGFDAALAWVVSKYDRELRNASTISFHIQKTAQLKDPTSPPSSDNLSFSWVATANGGWYPEAGGVPEVIQ